MKSNPEISVIICAFNRAKLLQVSLNAFTKQTINPDRFEIIIIDNNSTDNTELICKDFISAHSKLDVKYFLETRQGLPAARNRGIKESSGQLVAFIDDDAEVTENYLEEAIFFFENNTNISAMGGKIIPVYETGEEPEWLSKNLWRMFAITDYGDKTRKFPITKYPPGCSMVFRKEVFQTIGVFDTGLHMRCDDKYIFLRLKEHKRKFLYYPKLVLKHYIDKSRVSFEAMKKTSLIVGTSERARLRNAGIVKSIMKVIEYILKFFVALIIAVGFLFKLEFKKAEYLVMNRWYTLVGYFVTNI
jgi:glucosyl-dolichyl phosphate glucuronosyltransferase